LPSGSAPQLHPLAESLALLTARPSRDELDGEVQTLAAFRREFGPASRARRPRHGGERRWLPVKRAHWHRWRGERRWLPVKSAATVIWATAFGFGGLAAAASARTLPAPLQRLAHDLIAAPAPRPRPVTRPSSARPAIPGHSAYSLCTTWAQVTATGTPAQRAAAFTELAKAAGGPDRVTGYCAAVTHLSQPSSARPYPSRTSRVSGMVPVPHDTGQPSVLPTPQGGGNPSGPHSTGQPSGLPTPHGTGQPGGHPISRGASHP
jgi:hypothetical protein